jgi:hypothetical protein
MTELARPDLHAAIEQRYPDNTTERITPELLRDGLHEIVDSVVVKASDGGAVPNVPLYKVGTDYAKDYTVRYPTGTGVEAFYYSLRAGKLPAPSGSSTDVNWKVVPGPVSTAALSQQLTLLEAQGIEGTQVVAGRLYLITWLPNAQGAGQTVAVRGVSGGQFDVEGTLVVNGQLTPIESIDVTNETFTRKSGVGSGPSAALLGIVSEAAYFALSDQAPTELTEYVLLRPANNQRTAALPGDNLLDPDASDVQYDTYLSNFDGSPQALAGWNTTALMDVIPGQEYPHNLAVPYTWWFDKDKQPLQKVADTAGVAPALARYAAGSVQAGAFSTAMFLWTKPVPATYQAYWPVLLAAHPTGQPFAGQVVGLLGDSQTLQQLFVPNLLTTTSATRAIAHGFSGEVFRTGTNLLPAGAFDQADLIQVMFGTNEYGHGGNDLGQLGDPATAATIYGAVRYCYETLRTQYPTKPLYFVTPTERGAYAQEPVSPAANPHGLTIQSIAAAILAFCASVGVPVCDLYANSGITPSNAGAMTQDGLHWSNSTGGAIGSQLGQFVNEQFPSAPAASPLPAGSTLAHQVLRVPLAAVPRPFTLATKAGPLATLSEAGGTYASLGPDGRLKVGQAPGAGHGLLYNFDTNEYAIQDNALSVVQKYTNNRVNTANGQFIFDRNYTTLELIGAKPTVTYQSDLLNLIHAVWRADGFFKQAWYTVPGSTTVAASPTSVAPAGPNSTSDIRLFVSVLNADVPFLHVAPTQLYNDAPIRAELVKVQSLSDGRRDLVTIASNRFNDLVLERKVTLSALKLATNASSVSAQVLAEGTTAVSAPRTGSAADLLAALQADINGLASWDYYIIRFQTTPAVSTDVTHVLLTITA